MRRQWMVLPVVLLLLWAVLNLLPVFKITYANGYAEQHAENSAAFGDVERWCSLNYYLTCFHSMYSDDYPRFLQSDSALLAIMLVLPVLLTWVPHKTFLQRFY